MIIKKVARGWLCGACEKTAKKSFKKVKKYVAIRIRLVYDSGEVRGDPLRNK